MKSAAVVVLGEEGGMNVVFRMTELFGKDSFFSRILRESGR